MARVTIMARTVGTNDIETWRGFGDYIAQRGLFAAYHNLAGFNHPPLMGLWVWAAVRLGDAGSLGFPFVFKLLPLAGDLLAAWLLLRFHRMQLSFAARLGVVALFLCNPATLLITAYHGNTDPLLAPLCLWAALLARRQHFLGAGIALGCALNVKLAAMVLVLPLALTCQSRRQLVRYVMGLGFALIPFLPVLWAERSAFVSHVLGYNSVPGMWGLNLLFTDAQQLNHIGSKFSRVQVWFMNNARYFIMGGGAIFGLIARMRANRHHLEVCAFALSLSLVLAPGFGYQYLAWPIPLFFALNLRRAAVMSWVGGVFVGMLYFHFWNGDPSIYSGTDTWPRFGVVWSVFTWTALLVWAWKLGYTIVCLPTAKRVYGPLRVTGTHHWYTAYSELERDSTSEPVLSSCSQGSVNEPLSAD